MDFADNLQENVAAMAAVATSDKSRKRNMVVESGPVSVNQADVQSKTVLANLVDDARNERAKAAKRAQKASDDLASLNRAGDQVKQVRNVFDEDITQEHEDILDAAG